MSGSFFYCGWKPIFVSMSFDEIMKELKRGIYRPVYILMGDEPYFIDQISDYIAQNALSEADKGFNQLVMYGKDCDVIQIVHAARRFPMMAQRQLVMVREAQNVKELEELYVYVEKPLASTILVICYKYKTLDKRKKILRATDQQGVVFESKTLYDNKVGSWIEELVQGMGYAIDPIAVALLTEYLGSDLSNIKSSIEKLKVAVGEGVQRFTPEHIAQNIGISKDYNNFELVNAIGQRNALKANQIILAFAKNPSGNPVTLTISTLFGFFQKLLVLHYLPDKSQGSVASTLKISPFFAKDYMAAAKLYSARKVVQNIALLREYDMKSKGFESPTTSGEELLKELVFKLML